MWMFFFLFSRSLPCSPSFTSTSKLSLYTTTPEYHWNTKYLSSKNWENPASYLKYLNNNLIFFLPNCLKIINCWLIPAKNNADEFIPNGNKTIQILEIKRCSNICLINFADGIIMIYHYYMISLANYTIFSSILHDIVKRYLPHW